VGAALAKGAEGVPSHLEAVRATMLEVHDKLSQSLKERRRLGDALALLEETYPPYEEVVKAIEKTVEADDKALRRNAEALLDPVKALAASFARLEKLV